MHEHLVYLKIAMVVDMSYQTHHSICIFHDLLIPARGITYLHFIITKELTL